MRKKEQKNERTKERVTAMSKKEQKIKKELNEKERTKEERTKE
jgi:uncharacterized membrane protein